MDANECDNAIGVEVQLGQIPKSDEISRKKSVDFVVIGDSHDEDQETDTEPEPDISHEDLLRAATFILDAKYGRNVNFKQDAKYVRSYILYERRELIYLLYFCIALDMSLALFEKPSVPGWSAAYYVTMPIEFLCLVYFTIRTVHAHYFDTAEKFWKDTKNLVIIVLIVLTVLDMICYIIWANVKSPEDAIRWSRPLRPLFIVNFPQGRQIRRAFRNIRRTLIDILTTFVLFLLAVMLFALLALKLFYKRTSIKKRDGSPYFKNYLESFWDLYILVTTANNPDVMMPAYDYSNWFAIFFIIFVVICLYIFMSIVLAVIYNNYKKNLKNEVQLSVYMKRRKLGEAFKILAVRKRNHYVVSDKRWYAVMKLVEPKRSETQIGLLLSVVDVHSNNCIERKNFLSVADLIQVQLTEVWDRMTLLEKWLPTVYRSRVSRFIRIMVRHRVFRVTFDLLILINAIIIAVSLNDADWFFLAAFMVEILLKLYTFGPKLFFSVFWNVFDFFVIGAAVLASIILAIRGATSQELNTLDLLLVLRVLRLVKLFSTIKRFKVIITTIVNIGPSILTYGGVIFIFYYVFSIVGMELFHGKIKYYGYTNVTKEQDYCGNKKLIDSEFLRDRYCSNNFNDLLKAMVVLFELTVVNQWHVLASGFVIVTGKAARVYFFFFHICVVVIILNIFVAFVLEAFILEFSLSKVGSIESAVESKIKEMGLGSGQDKIVSEDADKNDLVSNEILPFDQEVDEIGDRLEDVLVEGGLRFHLKKKSSKKVEVLLQHMFEGEIDPEDEGPDQLTRLEDLDTYRQRSQTLSLDIVT